MVQSESAGMPAEQVRNWLGMYVLCLTAAIAAWLLLSPQRWLPIEPADRIASGEIVLPFLLGQISAVFRYYSNDSSRETITLQIPPWVVKVPPIVVTLLVIGQAAQMLASGYGVSDGATVEQLRAVLTFSVALLNASTVFVLARYFELRGARRARAGRM